MVPWIKTTSRCDLHFVRLRRPTSGVPIKLLGGVLIDLIIGFLDLIINPVDNQTKTFRELDFNQVLGDI